MTLNQLEIGRYATIISVGGEGSLRQHFLDMGMIPGQKVKLMQYAPLGDPMELLINGYSLTLRKAEAALIEIAPAEADEAADKGTGDESRPFPVIHPGLGEGGKYHIKEHENPLPKDRVLTFALPG